MAAARRSTMAALRTFALRLPDTVEGVACEGTALEARTMRTRDKAFLFLRKQDLRLKLGESLAEAAALAKKEPQRVVVGKPGWVQVKLDDATDPLALLERWVAESHRLFHGAAPARTARAGSPRRSRG